MNPDDEMLMAYADGELDLLTTKRVERAIADDPALAEIVAAHRALRCQLDAAFAPMLAEPVPNNLAALLKTNVVPFAQPQFILPQPRRWLSSLAVAASLVIGVALGTQWIAGEGPVTARGTALIASGELARALNNQLAADSGETRVLVSFREQSGGYCRVFAAPALDGIACKQGDAWQLRQTRTSTKQADAAYRQAASGEAELMAAAQDMMAGAPLDRHAEERARNGGWK